MSNRIATVIPDDGLRLRSTAGTDGAILGLLKAGQKVTITAQSGAWRRVETTLGTGFVHGDFITVDGQHPVNEDPPGTDPPLAGTAAGGTVAATSATTLPASYTVVSGDSLSGIGAKLGLNWRDIAAANALTEPFAIDAGQVLRLPGAAARETITAVTATTTIDILNPLGQGDDTRVTSSSNQGHHTPYGGTCSCDLDIIGKTSSGTPARFDAAAPSGMEVRGIVSYIGFACASRKLTDGGHKVQIAIQRRASATDSWQDSGAWVLYSHLDSVSVAIGDELLPGAVVGLLGPEGGGEYASSCAQGSHTHVEVAGASWVIDEDNDIVRDAVISIPL